MHLSFFQFIQTQYIKLIASRAFNNVSVAQANVFKLYKLPGFFNHVLDHYHMYKNVMPMQNQIKKERGGKRN